MSFLQDNALRTGGEFTANEIGAVLGVSSQAVRNRIKVPATGIKVVRGIQAGAWLFCELPAAMQVEIEDKALRMGYRDAAAALSDNPKPQKEIPAQGNIPRIALIKAKRRRDALFLALKISQQPGIESAEVEAQAIAGYQREFGRVVSKRFVRRILELIVRRDEGRHQWQNLELYISHRPLPTARPKTQKVDGEINVSPLEIIKQSFTNSQPASHTQKPLVWNRAFSIYEDICSEGHSPKKVKAAVISWLLEHAQYLSDSLESLQRMFNRKLELWQKAGRILEALKDSREGNSGRYKKLVLPPEDKKLFAARAILKWEGTPTPAYRELLEERAFSTETLAVLKQHPARKSYMPNSIRNEMQREIEVVYNYGRNPRNAEVNGSYADRDWSKVPSGAWVCADDVTIPVYYYETDETGKCELMRGQTLVAIDLRSTRILGFVLLSSRNYNAGSIRRLFTNIECDHGLPTEGFFLECGIWKTSKLLTGDPNTEGLTWEQTENGLRDLGLKFKHVYKPNAKPVERVIGELQTFMAGDRGFCGEDEMRKPISEHVRQKSEVLSGKVPASVYFYSAEEWSNRLLEICKKYNSSRNDGKAMTMGLTPDQAYEKFLDRNNPRTKLPPYSRYLLSNHRRPLMIGRSGVALQFGKHTFRYDGPELVLRRGENVLAWWDSAHPEIVTITGPKMENPICVPRLNPLPAIAETPEEKEQVARGLSHIEAINRVPREYFKSLKAEFGIPFRNPVEDKKSVTLGATIEAGKKAIKQRKSKIDQVHRVAEKHGVPISAELAETLSPPVLDTALSSMRELIRLQDKNNRPARAEENTNE